MAEAQSNLGQTKMERCAAVLLVITITIAVADASPAPFAKDLVVTKKLIDLTAQRLGQIRQQSVSASGSGLECDACRIIVDAIDTLFSENKTTEDIVAVITDICIELQIEDRNVCTLVVKEFQVC